jgi:hypothetical protein
MSSFAETQAQVMHLHARYCDAVIRKDPVSLGDCFTENCEWRISGMLLEGRGGAISRMEQTFRDARSVYIEFGTPLLNESTSGEISARTYMNERCAWHSGSTNIVIGRYFERYARDGSSLRFSWRLWQGLYIGPADLTGKYYDVPDYGPPPTMPAADDMPAPIA